jgi:anti-sigma regulatory factor (Ser/Thr protein kinase)
VIEAVEMRLPASAAANALARHCVEERLAPHLSADAVVNLKLVVSELVSNAVVHGAGEVTMRLQVVPGAVLVEVADHGTRSAPAIRDAADETGGWGLRIVEAVSRRWGVYDGSTHVWADIVR